MIAGTTQNMDELVDALQDAIWDERRSQEEIRRAERALVKALRACGLRRIGEWRLGWWGRFLQWHGFAFSCWEKVSTTDLPVIANALPGAIEGSTSCLKELTSAYTKAARQFRDALDSLKGE